MKNAQSLKRNDVVTLQRNAKNLNDTFAKGETFKFLGWHGSLARLSRSFDKAKLMVLPEDIGYTFELSIIVAPMVARDAKSTDHYGSPHSTVTNRAQAGRLSLQLC